MRISWNEIENYFQAEFVSGDLWSEDQQAAKDAGFRTTGSPAWIWYTTKARPLNKLRKNRPKSGLAITELAFQKYTLINEREQKTLEVKKEFDKLRKASKKLPSAECSDDFFTDPETGIVCVKVEACTGESVPRFVRPKPPEERCMICDGPLYFYENSNICLSCEIENRN